MSSGQYIELLNQDIVHLKLIKCSMLIILALKFLKRFRKKSETNKMLYVNYTDIKIFKKIKNSVLRLTQKKQLYRILQVHSLRLKLKTLLGFFCFCFLVFWGAHNYGFLVQVPLLEFF